MAAFYFIVFLIGIVCHQGSDAAVTCYDCTGTPGAPNDCLNPGGATLTDNSCEQCRVDMVYTVDSLISVTRGCETDFRNKADTCVEDAVFKTKTCRCSTEKCNNDIAPTYTCHKCRWDRDVGDKDFCRTATGIPSHADFTTSNCYKCETREEYSNDQLSSVTRGCGDFGGKLGYEENSGDWVYTCNNGSDCNNNAVVTRECQHCDWYLDRSDYEDCREGTDPNRKTECHQCDTVETFADDTLVRVERGCADPRNTEEENCDEADNIDIEEYPHTRVSSRTCYCKDGDNCNDVSGASVLLPASVCLLFTTALLLM